MFLQFIFPHEFLVATRKVASKRLDVVVGIEVSCQRVLGGQTFVANFAVEGKNLLVDVSLLPERFSSTKLSKNIKLELLHDRQVPPRFGRFSCTSHK